jgi:hypothetical protein
MVATIWRMAGGSLGAAGMLWFLLLLVPSSGPVVLDREPMAEHRVYLASAGFSSWPALPSHG